MGLHPKIRTSNQLVITAKIEGWTIFPSLNESLLAVFPFATRPKQKILNGCDNHRSSDFQPQEVLQSSWAVRGWDMNQNFQYFG
ncbi:Uncharacterised protein [Streptococcus criceti]|uniref:Uncharacterized protein n=1 Tax=Streptococcus criceti HS-6 TaxID=873449 RepID=G5JMJ1_STRCG|nr:hypothetical protein [Streptococcus criceti]EHI73306.1 hypothetical protein STRCR_1253 [Streptococcus criceti HS-6]SUN38624.1 Uncharacterised protein [Streptococcus criceti]